MGTQEQAGRTVELRTDDISDLDALYRELRGTPGIALEAVSAPIEPGDQGAGLELLTVACSSGAVTAFLELVRSFVEARGPKFKLRIRSGKNRIEISSDSVGDSLLLLEELFHEP